MAESSRHQPIKFDKQPNFRCARAGCESYWGCTFYTLYTGIFVILYNNINNIYNISITIIIIIGSLPFIYM